MNESDGIQCEIGVHESMFIFLTSRSGALFLQLLLCDGG